MTIKTLFASVVLVLASATLSSATPLTNTTGLAAPATTLAFNEVAGLANGQVITDQFDAYGVTFGSGSASAGLYYYSNAGNPSAGLQNYFPDTYNPFSIKFSGTVTEAAFNMITNGYTDKFTALLKGSVVEIFALRTGDWRYYGFSGIEFDEIQVEIGFGSAATNKHMRLDNLQFGTISMGAVPLPAGGLLLLTGLGAAIVLRRRKTPA